MKVGVGVTVGWRVGSPFGRVGVVEADGLGETVADGGRRSAVDTGVRLGTHVGVDEPQAADNSIKIETRINRILRMPLW